MCRPSMPTTLARRTWPGRRSGRLGARSRKRIESSCVATGSVGRPHARGRHVGGGGMVDARRLQRTFGYGFVADAVVNLQEAWMRPADVILEDDQLVSTVYEALAKRHPKSRTRGRRGAPAEMVLRLLLLKHIRNWSYAT